MQERYLYAFLAWFLAVDNLVFHFRLMTDASYQMRYHDNGSFGLVNDYIRVANAAGISLGTVATGMLFVNVVVLPLVVWLCIRRADGCDES